MATGMNQRSFSDVLEDVVGNVQGIIRSEVRLAKAEIKEESTKAGRAASVLGSGAVLGLYALGFLLLAVFFGLRFLVPAWAAAAILAVFVGVIAGILTMLGMSRMKHINPRPEKTIQTIKEDIEWAKHPTR